MSRGPNAFDYLLAIGCTLPICWLIAQTLHP
jgi:hypothetical protein